MKFILKSITWFVISILVVSAIVTVLDADYSLETYQQTVVKAFETVYIVFGAIVRGDF